MKNEHLNKTMQLSDVEDAIKFEVAVNILNEIQLDGETAEYLLECTGNYNQVFGQILRAKFHGQTFSECLSVLNEFLD